MLSIALPGLVLSACAGNDQTARTSEPPERTTIEALDEAVRPAAQAVLDAPAVEVTTLWFDEDGQHIRIDWVDYRNDGSFVLVNQSISATLDEMARIQLDDSDYCASSGPAVYCDVDDPRTNEPWSRHAQATPEPTATQVPISLDLAAMATGNAAAAVPEDDQFVTRRPGADGMVVWTLETSADVADPTREWTIDPAGFLRSYWYGSDTGLPLGLYSRVQFDFVIVNDPAPIARPDLGTPLDLDSLDLPADLPRLDL